MLIIPPLHFLQMPQPHWCRCERKESEEHYLLPWAAFLILPHGHQLISPFILGYFWYMVKEREYCVYFFFLIMCLLTWTNYHTPCPFLILVHLLFAKFYILSASFILGVILMQCIHTLVSFFQSCLTFQGVTALQQVLSYINHPLPLLRDSFGHQSFYLIYFIPSQQSLNLPKTWVITKLSFPSCCITAVCLWVIIILLYQKQFLTYIMLVNPVWCVGSFMF